MKCSRLPFTKMKQQTFIEYTPSTFLMSYDTHKAAVLPYAVLEVHGLVLICIIKKSPSWLRFSENASSITNADSHLQLNTSTTASIIEFMYVSIYKLQIKLLGMLKRSIITDIISYDSI